MSVLTVFTKSKGSMRRRIAASVLGTIIALLAGSVLADAIGVSRVLVIVVLLFVGGVLVASIQLLGKPDS